MEIEIANISVEICCALFLLTIFTALLHKRERSRSMFFIVLIFGGEIVAVVTDLLFRFLSMQHPVVVGLYIDYIISFSASVFLVCCFTWYFYARFEEKVAQPVGRNVCKLATIYSGFIILLYASSAFTGWFFYVDAGGHLGFTQYFFWVILLFVPLAFIDFSIIWRYRALLERTETAALLLFCVLPIIALALDLKYSTVTSHLALTLVSCMLYTIVDAEQEQRLTRSRQALAEMHLSTMVSQINPHFIYNTLSSIESLSKERPEEAQRLTSVFSEYLCDNYMDLTHHPLIDFEEELRHVEHYLAIEKVRFPNLTVLYDIRAKGFQLPCLSVQPLAENAVKHGICRRRKSMGTLRISSEETETAWLVRVEDDGVGFNTALPPDSARPHVGMENVAKRLELLCGGTLTVQSVPDVGTECILTIPKGGGA